MAEVAPDQEFLKDKLTSNGALNYSTSDPPDDTASGDSTTGSYYPFDAKKDTELRRLDEQHHALTAIMHGRMVHTPLRNPKRILDIGCGTGITTVHLAREYPDADIVAIDPFPVPPVHGRPPNVTYLEGKIEDFGEPHEVLKRGSFDFVFSRYLILAVSDWQNYIATAISFLRPGGWLEMQELNMVDFFSATSPDEPLHRSEDYWTEVVCREGKKLGYEHRLGSLLPAMLSSHSLSEVAASHYPQVFYHWDERPETDLMAEYMLKRGRPALPMIVRGMAKDYSAEQQQTWVSQIEEMYEVGKRIEGLHWRVWAVIGTKAS